MPHAPLHGRPRFALSLPRATAAALALVAVGCDGGAMSGSSRMPAADAGRAGGARDAGPGSPSGSDAGGPPAAGVDAGAPVMPPPGGDPCMGLDFLGECQGTLARWCDMGMLREMECGSAGCGWVDGTTGFYCGGSGPGPGGTGGTGGGADAGPPPPTGTGDCSNPTEQEELRLTNEARTSMGLTAFVCDERLTRAARLHSQDMCDQGYFDHTSADGRSFVDRITAQGATYSTAGENIAWGQTTPAEVHDGWMHSPGHRANILNGAFHRIGIGYAACSGRPYWTQDFTD